MQADLEAGLWHVVSEHSDLADCLPRVQRALETALGCKALVVRRFENTPPRLVTLAAASANPALAPDLQAGTKSELTKGVETIVRRLLSQQRVEWVSRFVPQHAHSLVGASLPDEVWGIPLSGEERSWGLAFISLPARETDAEPPALAVLQKVLTVAFKNDQAHQEAIRTREALQADREALLSRLGRHDISELIVGESGGLRDIMFLVRQVSHTDAPVLILGETGSGKEVIARAIHERSGRAGPVVRVNCGAIPPELIDSELFGHERGSFTGAVAARKGWFERADGGTLFLDEVGELPPAAQVRLLRVLQDGALERVGGSQTIHVDVRIVAATHRDLKEMVAQGTFRQDLWYRLSVFPMNLPPLRDRLEDLPALAAYFAERAGRRLGVQNLQPTPSDIELLRGYSWPGNVRELASVIERAAIIGEGRRLEVSRALGTSRDSVPPQSRLPNAPESNRQDVAPLDEVIRAHIRLALEVCQGRIEGAHGAAHVLGINPHTLRARMRKLGIEWSSFRPPVPRKPD